ncbi:hypothetical protein, partial [Streptococcus pneumoniae]|uniref:hypothetical protein n=1 Tax=Streptococcus pneumoniae TaxID=1313 RepID=UPI0018B0D0FB
LSMSQTMSLGGAMEARQEQRPDVTAIGEGMANLLGVQLEIRALLGKPSLADEIWARVERGEK